MTTYDPNPLSTYYMEAVLEERPTKSVRLGPRIGDRFLPLRAYSDYRIVWEKVREYSPIAGAYGMEDKPNTMDELDFETFQSDVLHWGARMTLTAKQIMFLRWAGQTNVVNANSPYGIGPAADDYRAKDAAKVAEYTRMMNEAMDNVRELLQMHALLGQIYWPPYSEDNAQIAAASLPLSMGRQKLNHAVSFLAATGSGATVTGGFHQKASQLTGISGDAGTQVAWSTTGTADPITDMGLIGDLMEDRVNLSTDNLLLLTGRRVLAKMASSTKVLDWILGKNRDREFLTIREQRDFVSTEFGFEVEFYQSKWEYVKQDEMADDKPTIHRVPFMPMGTVLIIPRPEIQEMGVLATCPAPGPAHNWQAGKYMWMVRDETPPWTTDMGMGAFWWPLVFDTDLRFRLDAWS